MIKKALLLGALVVLGGCGSNQGTVDASSGSDASKADVECVANGGYRPLPDGADIGLNAHMRSDRIFKNAKGATRRRVTYEVLDGSRQDAMTAVSAAMGASGYVAEPMVDGKDGDAIVPYKKDKSPRLWVKFKDAVGDKPANPDAKHLVLVEWQVKGAPKAAPAP